MAHAIWMGMVMLAYIIGTVIGYEICRKAAISAGAGRWERDEDTGEAIFKWGPGK